MPLSDQDLVGSLAERGLPDLVPLLQEEKWTGLLSLRRGEITKGITVEKGRMVFGMSTDPDERLGELLLRRGRISLRQLAEAGERMGGGKRLGTLLVEDGVLSPKELVRAVVDHTREIIYGAFTWAEGDYWLEPGQRAAEAITLNIDPAQLVLEGIRRIDSWRRIDRAVGGLQARYRSLPEVATVTARLALSPDERGLFAGLERPCSVEQLCAGSTLSSFEVCRLLWALRLVGCIEGVTDAEIHMPGGDEGLGAVLSELDDEG
jgi:hypothetical protein